MLELFNSIKSIIIIVKSVLGFLPTWCLVFVGSAMLLMIGILGYKLIRG